MRHENRWQEKWQCCREKSTPEVPAERDKHMLQAHTYINHVGDVVDIIFCHHCIGCCQVQQIVIPGFCAFQLILWILGLPLRRREENKRGRWRESASKLSNGGVFLYTKETVWMKRQVEMALKFWRKAKKNLPLDSIMFEKLSWICILLILFPSTSFPLKGFLWLHRTGKGTRLKPYLCLATQHSCQC